MIASLLVWLLNINKRVHNPCNNNNQGMRMRIIHIKLHDVIIFIIVLISQIRGTGCHQRDLTIPIPPNYTCMAVIATIFFFPVGVFAIMYAIKVC